MREKALAQFLNLDDYREIKNTNEENKFKFKNKEYYVLDKYEADVMFANKVADKIYEKGYKAFKDDFLSWILENALIDNKDINSLMQGIAEDYFYECLDSREFNLIDISFLKDFVESLEEEMILFIRNYSNEVDLEIDINRFYKDDYIDEGAIRDFLSKLSLQDKITILISQDDYKEEIAFMIAERELDKCKFPIDFLYNTFERKDADSYLSDLLDWDIILQKMKEEDNGRAFLISPNNPVEYKYFDFFIYSL